MLKNSSAESVDLKDVQFLLFSDEEIRKLSVTQITQTQSFDSLGNAIKGGLYDPAMGPVRDRNDICTTCHNSQLHCPGHFGHIELPLTVVNPLFIKTIYSLFRISCLKCFRLQMDNKMKLILELQLKLLDAGQMTAALDLENLFGDVQDKNVDGQEDKPYKQLRKYIKLLKKSDAVKECLPNKNAFVLRNRFINNIYKAVSIGKSCKHCKARLIKVTISDNKIMCNVINDEGKGIKILMPDELHEKCTKIFEKDGPTILEIFPILKHVKVTPNTDIFFMNTVLVPPPSVRPCNILQGELIEHPQSKIYKPMLESSFEIRVTLQIIRAEDPTAIFEKLNTDLRRVYDNSAGDNPHDKLHKSWLNLQKVVNWIVQCSDQGEGLKEIMEKKEGIIRMHMMGKRVNFAARSVITPDPNVDIDEIGIPDVFATKLTYPVAVTEWNVEELRKMVINGPNVHPGAEKIELENGSMVLIPSNSINKRRSLAKRLLTPEEYKSKSLKIVHRHLINGDVLILNRQPSLHKPSMMAHRARILKGEKTLRLHYANCKSYNADFDGDEMNAHFPQGELARSEAYNIMSVTKQYLVPKDGSPLSGLIQDHVISGVKMSLRGTFFNKADYHQLVFQGLANFKGEIKLLSPAILKPQPLWSGKQVLSTIIFNTIPKGKPYLSLEGKAKIGSKAWQKYPEKEWKAGGTPFTDPNTMSEAEVIIRKGELLCGVLDKTHYGATPFGLVHSMYELYGGESSSGILSAFSKLFTFYLQWEGFTLGVKDILVVDEANKKRDDFISIVRRSGHQAAAQATELPVDVNEEELKSAIEEALAKDPKFRANLDRQYKTLLDQYTNNINMACLSKGLLQKFPYNNLQLMVQSGAKGSTVNTMQISCLLGQIELEGKRPPIMISGRSLPSFPPYDISPRAGGFIDGRFMTGIQPQEFFFHCMAGREGLIDTAVKTSRSGYLQRCLIKHLEGLTVGYDMTVREPDGNVIQFAYGEDGFDVLKCQYLKEEQMKFLDENSNAVLTKSTLKKLKEDDDGSVSKRMKTLKKWKKKYGDPFQRERSSPFVEFTKINKNIVAPDIKKKKKNARDVNYHKLQAMWRDLDIEEKSNYSKNSCPDPVICQVAPEFKFGVLNERLDNIVNDYLKNRSKNGIPEFTDKNKFYDVISAKSLASLAAPGEPVGLLAAQSVGEPSTQMTLNTFHFAGRGDMNVTLGIPRLREILMTASANLKTPNMDIPFIQSLPDLKKKSEKLRLKLNRAKVSDVLEKIEVQCELTTLDERRLKSTMKFFFLPHSQYKAQLSVRPKQILKHMQNTFFSQLVNTIQRMAKTECGVAWAAEKEKEKSKNRDNEDEYNDEPVENMADNNDDASSDEEAPNADDDQTAMKNRKKHSEEQEYEDPESGEEENSDDEEEKEIEKAAEVTQVNETEVNEEHDRIATEVVGTYRSATSYAFDAVKHSWCEITFLFPVSFLRIDLSQVLREVAMKSVIHEVKNIKRAIIIKNNEELILKTDGINIAQMFKYSETLDINRLYTNDIHVVANTYGIEAAVKVIIKEIQNVFNVYGIDVDPRHLSLIADYMTFTGRFEPMSRKGMESSTSPFQQISFESSLVFLKQAILNAKKDSLKSVSSRVMVGQPCKCGTGAFDVLSNLTLGTNEYEDEKMQID